MWIEDRRKIASNYIKRRWFRKKILKKFNHKCKMCGDTENLQIDHIKPVWLGGTNTVENLQVLCKHCHIIKGSNEEGQNG